MSEHLNFGENGGPTGQENAAAAVDHTLHQLKASNKRKRDPSDHGGEHKPAGAKRTSSANNLNGNAHDAAEMSRVLYPDNLPGASGSSQDFNALSQQLARHVASHGLPENRTTPGSTAAAALAGIMPQLTVPQPTELSFVSTGSGTDADRQLDSSFDMGGENGPNPNVQGSPYGMGGFQGTATQVPNARETSNGGPKPAVGSDEWHKVRRDNHKEVERRRRETINEGINELAKIVPGCEKNKGSILQRAVQYITQLRENETKNIEKWTLEKLLTEQAIAELSRSVDTLKGDLERAQGEAKRWEIQCRSRDGDSKADDDAGGTDDDGDT
ncbi:basic helix-loop-helix protein [Pseudocyphellaria aurata]|nr:basic helix-loop-helix protein [Pseudocyphellaria aurata]